LHADKRFEINRAEAGDLVGMLLKDCNTGDTLTKSASFSYILEKISSINPVISLAIEPFSLKEQENLLEALNIISIEDPSFKFSFDENSNQIIISGMGELHLEIVVNRLLNEFKLRVKTGKPQVVYRETITEKATAANEYSVKLDEDTLYAYVSLEIEPLPRTGKDLSNEIVFDYDEKNIPYKVKEFIKEGVEEALLSGALSGSQIIDVKTTIKEIKDKTSKYEKGAFKVATINAFKEAFSKAKPIILQPVMSVIINTPDEYTGDIIGELNSKKAKIINIEPLQDKTTIVCEAYLSSLFGFTTVLRSFTKGKGNFSMHFKRYDQL
jgi:elongation factor G